MVNLEALAPLAKPKYRTTMEWWDSFTDEEKHLLKEVIINNPAPLVRDALRTNADFPFSTTAVKDLRNTLKGTELD